MFAQCATMSIKTEACAIAGAANSMQRVILGGLVASIAMAMVEMFYEGVFGVGFWAAPTFIAATILRDLQGIALPVTFSLVPVVLGMMGHMMNSVVLGFVYSHTLGALGKNAVSGALIGALYALALFIVMWFAVLPVIDPVMLNLDAVVFALSHIVWGGVLGFMVARRS